MSEARERRGPSAEEAAVLDRLPEALLLIRPDGEVSFLNAAAEALLGYPRAEVIGRPVTMLLPADARQRVDVAAWLARWGEHPDPEQWRYLHLQGRTSDGSDLRLAVRVGRFAAGDPPLYAVTFRDVSETLRDHAEWKHRYLLTARVLAISEDAVVTADGEQRITWANPATERLFGWPPGALEGEPLDVLIPERFRELHRRHVREFLTDPAPSRMMGERGEIVGVRRDGGEVPLEAAITKVWLDGRWTISAHLRDISARKAAEAALRDSEARFRGVFEGALEAMMLLDAEGRVLEVNDAARALLPADVKPEGERFHALAWWPPDAPATDVERGRAALEADVARAVVGETVRERRELARVPGAPRVLDFSLAPVAGADGRVRWIVAEGRDVTAILERGVGDGASG